jgi:hypothetical protein
LLRVDVVTISMRFGPPALLCELTGLSAAAKPVMTLGRVIALAEIRRFARSLFPREGRAPRYVAMPAFMTRRRRAHHRAAFLQWRWWR